MNGDKNHTFSLGMGTDIAFNRRLSLVGEYIPRLAGFGGFGNDRASLAGGIKIRTRRHVFQVLITNNRFMSPSPLRGQRHHYRLRLRIQYLPEGGEIFLVCALGCVTPGKRRNHSHWMRSLEG